LKQSIAFEGDFANHQAGGFGKKIVSFLYQEGRLAVLALSAAKV
jgi:hypothetical protein